MDGWRVADLKILALWAPSLFDSLASLLSAVEEQGRWPEPLVQGAVSFIPKEVEARLGPLLTPSVIA